MYPTLLIAAALHLLVAGVYAYVGRQMGRRQASSDGRLAISLFATWWYGLAGITALTALQDAAAGLGVTDLAFYQTVSQLWLAGLCAALFGLLYYLAYLFTGRRSLLVPIALVYATLYFALTYTLAYRDASAVVVGEWRVGLSYERDAAPGIGAALVALLIGPHLVGSLAYLSLYFKLPDRTQRYRVGMVAMSLLGWFSATFIASLLHFTQRTYWPIVSVALGLAAAVMILMAYAPPRFVRERFGIAAV